MIKRIKEVTFSNKRSLDERRFVLAGIISCVAVIAVLLSCITTQQSALFAIVLVLSFLAFLVTIVRTLQTKNYPSGGSVLILISNLLVLPVGYLMGGGVYSGAPLWFVMGIVFVFVLFRGKVFYIYMLMTLVSFGVAMFLGAKNPDWVTPLQETNSIHVDVYVAMACVAVLIGALLRFQSMVLERELEKAEAQTVQIENLNEMQNNFFSSMSHEIRTPISTIIGLNEMTMREKQLPTEVLENTLNIQNASKMLLSLINDILDMSKIQSGKMEIVSSNYDTSRMLSEITNLHWNRAMEKNLSFDIQVGENIPPMLYGDETRIKQIVINLLTNAIKYTEEGSVILRFGGEKVGGDKFLLRVEVEDTGIGIRKENLSSLFDSFRRVEGEDTKNIEGTGLGLSITKQLVDLMDGRITVNSIYTKGSTFRVEIPQKIAEGGVASFQKPGTVRREQPEYQQTFEAPNAIVLVVDDNDLNRIVCRKLLRATKVQVDLAESGRECLELTREKHYDAIFMDHEMPQMDGIETLQNIRIQSDGLCRDTPVIALTANAGSDRNAFYMEKGFSAYLSKPIQSSRLESLLLACLPQDLIERTYVETEQETLKVSEAVRKRPFLVTTDSICDMPEDLMRLHEIRIMPYYLKTERGRFRDMEEINSDNLQEFLSKTNQKVSSDPALVEEYENFFGDALTEARFVLHLSSTKLVSTAFENASVAAESFGNVYVVDSGMISCGLGLMAIRAAELLRSGLRIEELMQGLEQYRSTLRLQYLVPMLHKTNSKYRLPTLIKTFMNVFNMEPVFTVSKGRLVVRRFLLGYIRSTSNQFVRSCLKHNPGISSKRLVVAFSGCSSELREHTINEIEKIRHFEEIIVVKTSASSFINCGPNAIGLIYEKEEE